jgi:cell division protein FtsQ
MITETAEERRLETGLTAKEQPLTEGLAPKAKRESKKAAAPAKRPARDLAPIVVRAVLLSLVIIAGLLVWHQIDQFFISDPRFVLAGPTEASDASGLRVEGLKHTALPQLQRVFREDFGRSIYLTPLAERRRDLLALSWVKDASVSRVWPNHLMIRLRERKPFANVVLQIPNEGNVTTRTALIDDQGIILETIADVQRDLPVLHGISLSMTEDARRLRVQRVQRMYREAAELADGITEVDITDADNLKATRRIGDRAILLLLGREKFRPRLENFYRVVDQIRKNYAQHTVFDLRTRDIMSPGEQPE